MPRFFAGFLISILTLSFFAPQTIAKDATIKSSFDKKEASIKQKNSTEVNILFDSSKDDKISAATIVIKYPSYMLELVNSDTAYANQECMKHNYKLNQQLEAKNDTKKGILELTKVMIAQDKDLPAGQTCFATLTFKAKSSFWFIIPGFRRNGNIEFSDINTWQVVGPNRSYTTAVAPVNNSLSVTVTN